ncbi:DUF3375 family protein [Gimesia aquarii]|uniref:DUF3375 domain-containing protein n=1 Tax=Gimesia aquarii TaxID=2527964 RepID=A0A517W0K1_9PLAN|nr:DUF3375 family protein [Gimesia aquarii]QDT98782.1 hypothetical protein V144x_42900 [Gimesia aquarii]
MELDRLNTFFSTNPSAKLLRATHSAYVIHFLNQHFKVNGNLATPHSKIQQQLNHYLEQIHEREPEILRESADAYLTQWSTGETRWLRRYFDSQHAESVFQLTPHSEDVLKFLTEMMDHSLGFVGTESRLTRIIGTLSDIVVRGSADRERRLEHLHAERDRVESEIRSLESGDVVSTHSSTAIRERFADAISDLISLQGDFRAVEESFKSITRDVQKQQTEAMETRGQILGFALDAEDRLKEEDQGASFKAFVDLLLSQSQQDELEKIIIQLEEMVELESQTEGKDRVKRMISSLSLEAERVLNTTRRLNSTLRRLLDSKVSSSRLRLASVLREIQAAAVRQAEQPPELGINVFTELDLYHGLERPFWQPPVKFDAIEITHEEPDDKARFDAFRNLAEMQRLDWDTMRFNIASQVQFTERLPLSDLLETCPPVNGAIEMLGYIQIAHDEGHEVDENSVDVVCIETENGLLEFEIPRVFFLSETLRRRSGLRSSTI